MGQGHPGGQYQSGMKRRFTGISVGMFMRLPRRNFLHLAAGAAVLPVLPRIARAQAYPTRPITIVVPFVPGGPSDWLGRLVAERFRSSFGQPVVIENVAGANGSLASAGSRALPRTDT